MNKRIQELAVAAAPANSSIPHSEWNIPKEFIEKFAELIVQECVGCCEQVISDPVPESVDTWLNGGEQCIQEIKQHFGVEE